MIANIFLFIANIFLKYHNEFNWYLWILIIWGFLFALHFINVFITHPFLGKEWERKQRNKLVELQKEKIATIKREIENAPSLELKKKQLSRMITIIAAAGENNSLGKDNDLVWRLPDDFKRFKRLTTGHFIIMGRKTFESFPKPLPNRTHIVITRQKNYKRDGCIVVNSIEKALELANTDKQPFIIGGGEIYNLGIPLSDKIELTRVHDTFEADTFFPEIDENKWKLIDSVYHTKDEKHNFDFTYLTYIKK